jgi:ribonuclease HI
MIFTNSDGGARGNPGPAAIGVLVRRDEEILTKFRQKIGNYITNNVAEYEALIKALELASNYTDEELICFLDSELIVKQLLGKYSIRDQKLIPLFVRVQKLQENFKKISYQHVSREDQYQKIVDELLNEELDNEFGKRRR